MRILFISQIFPHGRAPAAGTFNRSLCRALTELAEVRVIAPVIWPDALRSRFSRNVVDPASLTEGLHVEHPTFWYTPGFGRTRYGEWMYRSVRRVVQRDLETWRPDAVLSYWAHPDGEAGLRVAQDLHIPSAVIVGGTDVLILPQEPARGACIRNALKESSAVIAISEGLRQATIGLGVPAAAVHTIYQGIDPVRFNPASQDSARQRLGLSVSGTILLWVGRMVDVKKVDLLIDACARLWKAGERFRLHLLGDGPLRPRLEEQARSLGMENVVHFEGPASQDQLPDWYRAADVTVISSVSEGIPNVLRESLACGTPFVATDVGSIREIATHSEARIVPSGDAVALAKALSEAKNLKSSLRQQPARTWNDCAEEMVTLFQTLRSNWTTAPPRNTAVAPEKWATIGTR